MAIVLAARARAQTCQADKVTPKAQSRTALPERSLAQEGTTMEEDEDRSWLPKNLIRMQVSLPQAASCLQSQPHCHIIDGRLNTVSLLPIYQNPCNTNSSHRLTFMITYCTGNSLRPRWCLILPQTSRVTTGRLPEAKDGGPSQGKIALDTGRVI